ncbi:hypothetical protein ABLE93_07555 [Xanthobacter sp. KR7-65]|uniref:hypothetical protein n=1 Tax=Xanthobacter sp. KR7-65 TaxID=3156612 RepID=UPI0032B54064
MTIAFADGIIRLEGPCRVEEAETLTLLLQSNGEAAVDVSACNQMHSAVVQVLLAFQPDVIGTPADAFMRDHLLPALADRRRREQAGALGRRAYGMEE